MVRTTANPRQSLGSIAKVCQTRIFSACYRLHVKGRLLPSISFSLVPCGTGLLLCGLLSLAGRDARCLHLPLPLQPSPPELDRARAAIADHQWKDADILLRSYLAHDSSSPEARYLLASTLFHERLAKESLAEYTQAAKLRPPTAVDLQTVALDYVLLNDYPDADIWITRSSQMNPRDGETWYALGRIRYTENRFNDAVVSFQRALLLLPRSVKVENNLGLAWEGLNQPDEAIRAYRQAISWQAGAKQPSEQPLLNLATLLSDRNQLDEALALLQQAVAIAPQDPRIHTALGKLYRRRDNLPQAQAEFESALAVTPNDAALHFQLGQVYRKEGLEARASSELARAAALNGTHSSPER